MNKRQKELLAVILWDIGLVDSKELDEDSRYHLFLANYNLRELIKELNIKEHGDGI